MFIQSASKEVITERLVILKIRHNNIMWFDSFVRLWVILI